MPAPHVVHCWSVALPQVTVEVQPVMGAQVAQTRSVALVQATLSKAPGAQALAHVAQVSAVPFAPSSKWVPSPQLVHC